MDQINKTVITISSYGTKVKVVLDKDATLDEIVDAIKGMLVSITFPVDLVKKIKYDND